MIYDSHVHSTVSFDGYEDIGVMCAFAQQAGLHEICFCEHVELGHVYPIDWDGKINWAEYARQIEAARAAYPGLLVRKGAEIGLSTDRLEESAGYIRSLPLDFVIASQHQAKGRDPYADQEYYIGRSVQRAIQEFLQETYACLLGFEEYDVVGHLTFASLYAPIPRPLEYADHPEILDGILKLAVSCGKGIEVNTTGYHIYGAPMATLSVIKRFRQLGGEIATVGSDAHFSSVVGFKYNEAAELLRAAGFGYVCTFQKRKPVFHRL